MLLPHDMLVLTVDGQNARLLRNSGTATSPRFELVQEKHMSNPPDRELMSDRPGRTFGSAAIVRHAYQEDSVHDRNEAEFAIEALNLLDRSRTQGAPTVLIAPPHILGVLRAKMSAHQRSCITHEINKDLMAYRPEAIGAFLADYEPQQS